MKVLQKNCLTINNILKVGLFFATAMIHLSPISANISRLTSNTKETSRISNASYSLYHNTSTIEYKPYTLKDYKELEKVGVVLGGLGPNIGTKEWEEKKNNRG